MNLDHTLSVVLLLAMLAAISERLVELLKLGKFHWSAGGIFERWKARYGRESSEYAQRVALITVFVSLLVAWALGADFLVIVSQPTSEWFPAKSPPLTWSRALGLLAAGLAASFGSRTWHDLAEQLMLAKNLKRSLLVSDGSDTAAAQDRLREDGEACIALHRDAWFAEYPQLTGVSVGYKEVEGIEEDQLAILFEVETKLTHPAQPLPFSVEFRGRSIPTDVIATGRTLVADYRPNTEGPLLSDTLPVELGFGTHRAGHPQQIGTLGLRVLRGNDTFALTCMHVACPMELASGLHGLDPGNVSRAMFLAGRAPAEPQIGTLVDARFDEASGFDLALVHLSNGQVMDRIANIPGAPTGIRQISPAHIRTRLAVELCGFTSRHQRGVLLDRDSSQRIDYEHASVVMHHLIRSSRIAAPGDSGAAVVDSDGRVVGIVLATNRRFTYLMPIAPALGALGVTPDLAG